MSDATKDDSAGLSLQRWAAVYLVLLVIIAGALVLLLLPGDWLSIQFLFLLVVLLIPWHQSTAILLFMVLAALVFRESVGSSPINNSTQARYWPIPTVGLSMLFMITANRFCVTWKLCDVGRVRSLLGTVRRVFGRGGFQGNTLQGNSLDGNSGGWLVGPLLKSAMMAAAIPLFAWVVLTLIPENPGAIEQIRMRPREYRAITLMAVIAAVGIFCSHIMSGVFWRFLNRQQARIYLRSQLSGWLEPETRAIVRARRKRMTKLLKKRKG